MGEKWREIHKCIMWLQHFTSTEDRLKTLNKYIVSLPTFGLIEYIQKIIFYWGKYNSADSWQLPLWKNSDNLELAHPAHPPPSSWDHTQYVRHFLAGYFDNPEQTNLLEHFQGNVFWNSLFLTCFQKSQEHCRSNQGIWLHVFKQPGFGYPEQQNCPECLEIYNTNIIQTHFYFGFITF